MATLQQMVKAVCPDFPDDGRKVQVSGSPEEWYHVDLANRILKVPNLKVLHMNPREIDNFAEAVNAFAIQSNWDSEYDWEHLDTFDAETPEDCIGVITDLMYEADKGKKIITIDIETRKVFWEDNKLLAIGFCNSWSSSRTIRCFTPEVLKALQQLFDRTDIYFGWHNGKFDTGRMKYFKDIGIRARVDEDTMLLHYIAVNEKKGTHGLKELGALYLQAPKWDDELDTYKREWCRRNKKKLADFMYDDIPINILLPYLNRDCIATFRLLHVLKKIARPDAMFLYKQLMRASNAYREVELNGVYVDANYIGELSEELYDRLEDAQKAVDEAVAEIWDPTLFVKETGAKSFPKSFNIKSPKQLKWLLEKACGHHLPNTSAETVEDLVAEMEMAEDSVGKRLISRIGTLRKTNKYVDTYVNGILDVLCNDGRVRCTYNLHGTETGRLSCKEPNMQNIPRNKLIKNLFVAPKGRILVQFDYSQAELRVLAALSGDDWMIQQYVDGKDLHAAVAEQMFGPNFDKEQRNKAKTINFGVAYGRGPSSLVEAFGMSMVEARKLIEDWFKPMPKVKKYIQAKRAEPTKGIPCVTPLGFMRHFVVTNDNLNHVENESINTPIQSTASFLTMFSLIEMQEKIEREHLDAKIVITVHDSIILEVADDDELLKYIVESGMQIMHDVPLKYFPECRVPFKADADVGYRWGELKSWEEVYEDRYKEA